MLTPPDDDAPAEAEGEDAAALEDTAAPTGATVRPFALLLPAAGVESKAAVVVGVADNVGVGVATNGTDVLVVAEVALLLLEEAGAEELVESCEAGGTLVLDVAEFGRVAAWEDPVVSVEDEGVAKGFVEGGGMSGKGSSGVA